MKKYLFLITSFLTALVASGATWYVVPNGAGNKDGTSWSNAYADVQNAIDSASSAGGGEVWIAKGTYKHGSAMTMKNNVAIYGGFAGTETSREERVAGNETVLDGEGKYRVFYNNYSSSNKLTNSAKLDNVTIQNGYTYGSDLSDRQGAGMYNNYASPEITNCTFSGNSTDYGGGMYNTLFSSPVLTNCTFSNNSASFSGGGMYNNYASPEITNCTFSNNSASSYGGGMYNESSSPVLTNCTFSGNSVSGSSYGNGGGMYNTSSSSPKLTNCTFSGNSASGSSSRYGGGMYNTSSSSPKLTNCILWGNIASSSSNEIYNYDSKSKPTIDTCIIKGGYSSYGTYTNIITADPKLIPLGNYAGNVQTIAVAEGSSAIGAGKVVEEVITDARGFTRSSTSPTIGAYEVISIEIKNDISGKFVFETKSESFEIETQLTDVSYQWQFSSNNEDWQDIENATSSILALENITNSQAGYYRCMVSKLGWLTTTSNVAQLSVRLAPSVDTQPTGFEVFATSNGSLSVSATGEELTYQWYFNGEAIEGATESTLSFKDIQSDKIGSYYCVVSNPAGSVKSEVVSVVVKPAPSITTQPEALDIFTNNDGSLSVVATGESLTYQWYFNEEVIEGATDSSLSFDNIQADKSGEYYCVITNPAGSVKSEVVSVLVKPAPSIATQPEALDIFTNNDGSLSVVATGESLTYQWYFNEEVIEGATESTLSFEDIQADKSGEYYCVITNPAGSVKSEVVSVLVKPAPSIATQPEALEIFTNHDGSLSVSATGEELTYQWYFNEEAIEGATESTLSFEDIQSDKIGSYYCVVSNPAGSVKSEVVSVLVKPAPTITTQPETLEIFTNHDGSLSVVATGESLTYQWYKVDENDDIKLEGKTSSTLSFDSIQVSATGSYYCIITNPAGSVQSSIANVVVRQSATEDSITKELEKVTTISGIGYARFVVETTAYNPTYKWYYGSDSAGWTEFENETSNILFIPAESKYNRKNIKCEISNGGGSVSTQAVLVYSSTAIQITSQPQDVSFKLNENASFDVTVSTSTGNAYYQWQYSADGNEWQNIENATEATYSFKMIDSKNRGYYRCEIDNGGGVLYSENAKIIFPKDVAITTQPTAITSAIIGTKATFTVVVSGDDPKYKWQVSYDYGDTWENIAGATNATLNVDVVANVIENSYRCLVWNDNNVDVPLESEMVWIENVIEPTAFQEWSMANGLGIDASPSAILHNDGITNLEKFAFGLDASKATSYDANANFKHTSDSTGATLQFPISVDAEGVVQVKALKSTDLINWTEATATATGEISSDGKFKIYKVTAPVGEDGKVFLKLQVEEK